MSLTTPLTMSHRAAAATTLLRLGSKGFYAVNGVDP